MEQKDLMKSGLEDSICRIRLRVRPEAKNVAVRIFDLKLVGPAEILRRASDVRALSREFGEEYISVLNADPEPGTWLALFTFTQHDRFAIARHGDHPARIPIQRKTKRLDVIAAARFEIFNAQDRRHIFDHGHGAPSCKSPIQRIPQGSEPACGRPCRQSARGSSRISTVPPASNSGLPISR